MFKPVGPNPLHRKFTTKEKNFAPNKYKKNLLIQTLRFNALKPCIPPYTARKGL